MCSDIGQAVRWIEDHDGSSDFQGFDQSYESVSNLQNLAIVSKGVHRMVKLIFSVVSF